MRSLSFGVKICRGHTCVACRKSEEVLGSNMAVEAWLTHMAVNPLLFHELRLLALGCGHDRLNRLSDQDVVKTIAQGIASGALRICNENWSSSQPLASAGASSSAGDESAPETVKPFPLQDRTRTPPPQPAKPDEPTFSSDLNVHAQVLALASAAAQGVPFCPE